MFMIALKGAVDAADLKITLQNGGVTAR